MKKTVITYGTFDLFHIGHLNLLNNLKSLGDELIVAVSTDEFNTLKGKKTIVPFEDRIEIVRNIKSVDLAIPESDWQQKEKNIKEFNVSIFGMGHDWQNKFNDLKVFCEVIYLPRTEDVSSTSLKQKLKILDRSHITDLKHTLDLISSIVERFE
ncbi:adenylyltransferase/cytidyltransferase family protein [Pseudomonas fragi]|uniref:adenylyltransferase/cytidyltransferase family protein n=1 Tax=Pseudomonas fragi TaxID=296 RepID=UPI002954B3BC|nr:adenylyltransferase/cytidyltransferase family protein [Pseudomonas fragi]WOL29972.1 adenylyltransferase/cytidyltransferase family protein [Pseudomonas fragi]